VLGKIINYLNGSLVSTDERFAGSVFYGIDERASRGQQLFPNSGEQDITPDNARPLVVYHKILSKTYAQSRYADEYDVTYKMRMICYSNAAITGLDAEHTEALIFRRFPQGMSTAARREARIGALRFIYLSSDFSRDVIFAQEYRNTAYRLGEHDLLFAINYDIEATLHKKCIDTCCDDDDDDGHTEVIVSAGRYSTDEEGGTVVVSDGDVLDIWLDTPGYQGVLVPHDDFVYDRNTGAVTGLEGDKTYLIYGRIN
jgi:hypothetical protein